MHMLRQFTMAMIVMVIAGVIASGCNTFKGAGKDIQKGGRAVEGAAEDVENTK
jgi:predicted small secreted protein